MSALTSHQAQPGVFSIAGQAWRSAWLATRAMPLLVLVATVTLLASYAGMTVLLAPLISMTSLARVPFSATDGLAVGIGRAVVLSPLAIAVHRFVLLGERTRLWPRAPTWAVLYFMSWLIAPSFVDNMAELLKPLTMPGAAITTTLQLVLLIVLTRLSLMLPAIAVQSSQPLAELSWHQTRHRFWRTVAVLFVVEAPIVLANISLLTVASSRVLPMVEPVLFALAGLAEVLGAIIGASALSWLFRRYDVTDEPGLIPAAT